MPIYEFECPKCGHIWTDKREVHDRDRSFCPLCFTYGERIFTPPFTHFKGPDFTKSVDKGKE